MMQIRMLKVSQPIVGVYTLGLLYGYDFSSKFRNTGSEMFEPCKRNPGIQVLKASIRHSLKVPDPLDVW